MMRYENVFSIRAMCRVLKVSASGYYDWRDRTESLRSQEDRLLLARIEQIHHQSKQAYGYVKTWKALQAQGILCGKHRVARLRKQHRIETKRSRRFKITTRAKQHSWAAKDYVKRQFHATRPNQVWAGDVTFIPTKQGWLYLAILLDLYSRKIVGWAMSKRNNGQLVEDALKMAIVQRQPNAKVIHHTDRGRLYATEKYRALMQQHHIVPSMGRKGDCYDNAVSETFFSTLKNELTHHKNYQTREQAKSEIFEYIECFYNRKRIHQTLNYQTPVEYENNVAYA